MNPFISDHSYIDRLPPEVLEKVFDTLPLQDRKIASLVCRLWYRTLRGDRYISRVALKVRPSTLESDWALEGMKRPFHKMVISSDGVEEGPRWKQFRDRVQCLVQAWAVRKNVKMLLVMMSARAASEIFDHPKMVRLMKLEESTYSPGPMRMVNEDIVPRINVHAPRLNSVKIDCFNQSCIEFLHLVSPKVKRLVLRFVDKSKLIGALSISSFDRLRELSIHSLPSSMEQEKMLSRDVGETFKLNLDKLDKLSIRDGMNTFPFVYHLMFTAASNLTYLNVEGIEMHPLALHAVNNITKLEVLQLLADTTYQNWSCEIELCLPELRVLLLFPKLMARAGYLPKLQKFAIHNNSVHAGILDENANEALRTFSMLRTIQLLHLRDIVFSEETLEVVCSFRSSPQILLEDIWENIRVLHKIVNSYSSLKLLKMVHCRFKAEQEDPYVGDTSDDSEWETLQQAESVGQTFEFYTLSKLAELFPNCKVEVHESYFMKQIGKAPWRQVQRVDELAEGKVK